jgi:hypothetical protein
MVAGTVETRTSSGGTRAGSHSPLSRRPTSQCTRRTDRCTRRTDWGLPGLPLQLLEVPAAPELRVGVVGHRLLLLGHRLLLLGHHLLLLGHRLLLL